MAPTSKIVLKRTRNREKGSEDKILKPKKKKKKKFKRRKKTTTTAAMNSVFSVDEISDQYWSTSPAMNRSASEWALERFLEEFSTPTTATATNHRSPAPVTAPMTVSSVASPSVASQSSTSKFPEGDDEVVEIKKPENRNHLQPPSSDSSSAGPVLRIDSDQYHQFLKNQLDLACAAVALSRV